MKSNKWHGSLALLLSLLFIIGMQPMAVFGYGSNSDTLNPSGWEGEDNGAELVRDLSDQSVSFTLINDGTFRVNAPNLPNEFSYTYSVEQTQISEGFIGVYMIFSSKKNFEETTGKIIHGLWAGEGTGNKLITTDGSISLSGGKYIVFGIIENKDYPAEAIFNNSKGEVVTIHANTGMVYAVDDYAIPYGILFNVGTAHGMAPNAISYDEEGNVTLPNIEAEYQHLFDGWYTEATGGTKVGGAGDIINWDDLSGSAYENTTLYAQWKTPTQTYTAELNTDRLRRG